MKEGEEGVSKDKETVVPEHRGGVGPITTGMDCYNVQNWKFGTEKRTTGVCCVKSYVSKRTHVY